MYSCIYLNLFIYLRLHEFLNSWCVLFINVLLGMPLEILARGPEALRAYKEAMRAGQKKIYQTRLMLVGQERVGKTSLKKSLTGQE